MALGDRQQSAGPAQRHRYRRGAGWPAGSRESCEARRPGSCPRTQEGRKQAGRTLSSALLPGSPPGRKGPELAGGNALLLRKTT